MTYRISASSTKKVHGKVEFVRTRTLVSFFCILFALCGSGIAQDFKLVQDGVEHAQVTREFSGKPVNINVLRLDLKKVQIGRAHV